MTCGIRRHVFHPLSLFVFDTRILHTSLLLSVILLIYCLRPDIKYNRLFIVWLVLYKELGQNSGPVFQICAQGG